MVLLQKPFNREKFHSVQTLSIKLAAISFWDELANEISLEEDLVHLALV